MNNSDDASVAKELHHQYRIMNMWLTIYQKLFTRYRLRAKIFELILLLCALLLCLTTFVDHKILQFILITSDKSQMILGFSSFALLIIALLSWVTNWKERAAYYGQAVDILCKTRIECGELLKLTITETEDFRTKSFIFSFLINNLPQITEKEFHRLKAFHKRQLEVDKMIDRYPGSSVWLLRGFIFFQANIHVLLRKPFVNQPDAENLTD
jgi:hypothetical protein